MNSGLTYGKVFEAVGDFSAIGRGAALDCRILLEAGYRVSVVSKLIDADLKKEVDWHPLYVPPRGFALQWLSARHYLLGAMKAQHADVIHAHQPQISDSCDVFQCHFLTRAVAKRGLLAPWRGKKALTRGQEEIVLRAEDRYYRRLANLKSRLGGLSAPRILFISDLMQREFHSLYGDPIWMKSWCKLRLLPLFQTKPRGGKPAKSGRPRRASGWWSGFWAAPTSAKGSSVC